MGSGISTKYQIDSSYGTYYISEKEAEYGSKVERVFDEDFLNDFCNEKISQKPIEGSSIESNYQRVKDKYPLRTGGNLGDKTDHTKYNVKYSEDPIRDAMEMYSDLSYGGKTGYTDNLHGIQTDFRDGSHILFRPYSSIPGSPSVDITVINPSSLRPWQRIHFLKK